MYLIAKQILWSKFQLNWRRIKMWLSAKTTTIGSMISEQFTHTIFCFEVVPWGLLFDANISLDSFVLWDLNNSNNNYGIFFYFHFTIGSYFTLVQQLSWLTNRVLLISILCFCKIRSMVATVSLGGFEVLVIA